MEIVIILAILAAGWLGWTQWKKAEAKRASRPKGNWGDPSGGAGPSDDSPKWGGKPDEAHDDDLGKPITKAKKPRAKKKKKPAAKRGGGGRKKSKEGNKEGMK